MANSGIKVDREAVALFSEMKQRKKKVKFATFKITDDETKVVSDYISETIETQTAEEDEEQWEEMKKHLKPGEPCFILFDFRFSREGKGLLHKIGLIKWCEFCKCSVKKRMLFATTSKAVEKAFEGIRYSPTVNDLDDFDYATHNAGVQKG